MNKAIFIHVPKCAGMSIAYFCRQNGILIDPINRSDIWIEEHKGYQNIENVAVDFSFAFVRNPFSRMVSAWKCQWVSCNQYKTFKDFILYFFPQSNSMTFFRRSHVLPFTDDRMKLFNSNGNQLIDFIGKVENLQEDFNIICDKIGISLQQVPHRNKTNHKHYTEYYDDETRAIVAQKYAKDIEYFDYKFGE